MYIVGEDNCEVPRVRMQHELLYGHSSLYEAPMSFSSENAKFVRLQLGTN